MTIDIDKIDSICISGGGNKCFTFVGALKYLQNEKNFNMENIKTYCGTSGGAIICYFLVLGYTLDEIQTFLVKLNFYKIINNNINLDNLINNYGLDDGNKIMFIIKELLFNKYNIYDITFQDLYNLTKKEFIIIGTNYTRSIDKIFSYKTTPDLSILTGIRITISIPFVFTPVLLDDEYYVDGGITSHFPIQYCNPDTTIGLNIKNCIKNEMNNLLDIYFNCFNIIFDSISNKIIKNNDNIIEIVNIPEMNSKGFSNFNLDEDYKQMLLDLGYNCAKLKFETNNL